MQDLTGKLVSESEVANNLGFKDVTEFRRYQTEQGTKISELEFALKSAKRERDSFQWYLKRMMYLLNKCKEHIKDNTLLFAINVEEGREVDWNNELKSFWENFEDFSVKEKEYLAKEIAKKWMENPKFLEDLLISLDEKSESWDC